MAWSQAHDFRLSASLHQGALVANYPFDSCDTQVCLSKAECGTSQCWEQPLSAAGPAEAF